MGEVASKARASREPGSSARVGGGARGASSVDGAPRWTHGGIEPRGDEGESAGFGGEAVAGVGEFVWVCDVLGARAPASEAVEHGEGVVAIKLAKGGAGGPVFGEIDGGVTVAVAGFDVGAGGEEEDGARCASLAGGEVKASAPALVEVVNGAGESDKRVVSAKGAEEDNFAVRKGDDGGGGAVGESGGGDAVGEGDETSGMGVAGGEGRARVASGFEDVATYYGDGDAGVFGAKLRDGLVAKAVSASETGDGLVARARRGVRRDKESGCGDVGRRVGGRSAAGTTARGVMEVGAVAEMGQSCSAQRQCGSWSRRSFGNPRQ